MTFLGRVLEYRSQKVLLRKLDDDVVEALGRCLLAAIRGPFFTDRELADILGRSRASLRTIAGMWPRLNLAAPDLRELLGRLTEELVERADAHPEAWDEWIGVPPESVEASFEVFRKVSTGEI